MLSTFLMSSRLGLLHVPQGQTELNVGVETGPQQIITDEFAAELQLEIEQFFYSSPDQVTTESYYQTFAQEATTATRLMSNTLGLKKSAPFTSLVVGGDHSVSLAHLAAVVSTVADPETTGIVMMDSHGDLNLRESSPTGNIHGMWLRAVVDQFDVPEINQLVLHKVPAQNLLYIGNLDLDPAEQEFLTEHQVPVISVEGLQQQSDKARQLFADWVARFAHVHLSIDIDGFDGSIAPATGIPCAAGFFPQDVLPFIEMVKMKKSWSLDLVEVNPQKTRAQQTIALAQEVLRAALTVRG